MYLVGDNGKFKISGVSVRLWMLQLSVSECMTFCELYGKETLGSGHLQAPWELMTSYFPKGTITRGCDRTQCTPATSSTWKDYFVRSPSWPRS